MTRSVRRPTSGSRRPGVCDSRGTEILELALVLPLLMIVVVGIIEYAFLFQSYEVVTNAAREGARVGVLPGYGATDIQSRVAAYLTAAGLPGTPTTVPARVAPVAPETNPSVRVSVTYTHQMSLLRPMLTLIGATSVSTLRFTASSSMRCEATV